MTAMTGRTTLISAAILFVFSMIAFASQDPPSADLRSVFREANADAERAIAAKSFEEAEAPIRSAIQRYHLMIASGVRNGYLYYNLGNSYMRIRDVGEAIYWYRMAERLIPQDTRLRANLRYARSQTRTQFPAPASSELWRTLFFFHYLIPFSTRLWIFLAFWNLFWILMAVRLYKKSIGGAWLAAPLVAGCLIFGLSAAADVGRDRMKREAVLVQSDVVARKGDAATYEPVFSEPLGSGVEVEVLQIRDRYTEVRFTSGVAGWVPSSALKILSSF